MSGKELTYEECLDKACAAVTMGLIPRDEIEEYAEFLYKLHGPKDK